MAADFIVNIDVPDLAAATQFYRDGLGLSEGRKFSGVTELLGGPAPIYLLAKAAGSDALPGGGAPRSYVRHWTPMHLDFITDDLDAAVARALAAGALLESPARSEPWGRIALLADPFGNGFCLIQFVGRGYDAIAEAAG
jgi:catechol 2,3-dioxygenase-like lactoylglutathione lyase family enzyme